MHLGRPVEKQGQRGGRFPLLRQFHPEIPVFRGPAQHSCSDATVGLQVRRDLSRRPDQVHLAGKDIALLHPVDHALPEFCLHGAGVLEDPQRFIQKDQGLVPGEEVQQALRHGIEVVDKALQARKNMELLGLLPDPGDLRLQPVGSLGVPLVPEPLHGRVHLLFHPAQAVVQTRTLQDHLGRGKDADVLQLLHRALAQDIKAADGLDLVSPELDADRIFLGQIKDIDDIAPDRELARPLGLVILFIAHPGQAVSDHGRIDNVPLADPEHIVPEDPEGDLGREQGGEGRDHCHRLALQDPPKAPQPLLVDLVSAQVRLIKDQVSGGEDRDVPVVEGAVLGQFPGPQVAVGQHQAEPGTGREVLLPAKSIEEVGLLRVRAGIREDSAAPLPAPGNGSLRRLQLLFYVFICLQLPERVCKNVHPYLLCRSALREDSLQRNRGGDFSEGSSKFAAPLRKLRA